MSYLARLKAAISENSEKAPPDGTVKTAKSPIGDEAATLEPAGDTVTVIENSEKHALGTTAKTAKSTFWQLRQYPLMHVSGKLATATLQPPAPSPTPDPAGNAPYRLNIAGRAQLVWLPPGLEPAEVLQRAKALYPDVEVSDQPPLQGWPSLADIREMPKAGIPPTAEEQGANNQIAECRTCLRYEPRTKYCGHKLRHLREGEGLICAGKGYSSKGEPWKDLLTEQQP